MDAIDLIDEYRAMRRPSPKGVTACNALKEEIAENSELASLIEGFTLRDIGSLVRTLSDTYAVRSYGGFSGYTHYGRVKSITKGDMRKAALAVARHVRKSIEKGRV